jgi:signal transduction histidine kinase
MTLPGHPLLHRTLIVYTGLGFLALLVVLLGSIWLTRRMEMSAQMALHTQRVAELSSLVLASIRAAESGQRGFLLTGDERYLDPLSVRQTLPPMLIELRQLVKEDPQQLARINALQVVIDRKLGEVNSTVMLYGAGRRDAAIAVVRSDQGLREMEQIRGLVLDMRNAENRRLLQSRKQLNDTNLTLLMVDLAMGGLVMLMAAASISFMNRFVLSLQQASDSLDELNRGLEETVEARTREIVHKTEEVQRFAYIVSHDLRAPLVNIMGFTRELENAAHAMDRQIAAVETQAPELIDSAAAEAARRDVPEAVGYIRSSSEKMDRLIRAVLALAREGQRPLTREPIDMNALIRSIADSLQHQVKTANAELIVEGDLPVIQSDRLTVEQGFGNLLDNAIKYLDSARPGRIVVRGAELPRAWRFEVEDNGRGIDPKDQERVFQLFRRAGGARDRPGDGLGLAFVRASIQRLGGEVRLQSTLGIGSVFSLELPKPALPAERNMK